ncbi:MAG TPA: hypothetical protein DIT39_00530 [Tissierellales bacterium]|jgi:RIO-like serine/threonine protein kinase|nr:hypothetical protein [Tissierellales bacterium]
MCKKVKLTSKRNKVYRLLEDEGNSILKTFIDKEDMKRELSILRLLHGRNCRVPEVLKVTSDSIYLEDLGDETLLDWYESIEKTNADSILPMILKLSDWLEAFYDTLSSSKYGNYIMGDVNFRNFLIKDGEIYGIDFEQCREGKIEEDLGKLAAYSLTYDPMMTDWKKNFVKLLVEQLSMKLDISKDAISSEMDKELIKIRLRRKEK